MAKRNPEVLFGINAIAEALEAGRTLTKVWVKATATSAKHRALFEKVRQRQIPCARVPLVKLNKLTSGNHQGIVALLSPIDYHALDDIVNQAYERGKPPLILLLDGVQDIHNLGALARTALAAGADAIVTTIQESAPVNGTTMKASAGALNHLPVCRVANLGSAIQSLKASGLQVVAATEKATETYYQVALTPPLALLLGNEGSGIHPRHLNLVDKKVTIPMAMPVTSLNVSVAGGILLYEVARQVASKI